MSQRKKSQDDTEKIYGEAEALDYKVVGYRICVRRKAFGLTQAALAELVDVNPSHISNIERGAARPSLNNLINICNVLKCSMDYFIGNKNTETYIETAADLSIEEEIVRTLKSMEQTKKEAVLSFLKSFEVLT